MPTDTSVNNLVINKLTKAQYDGIATKSETELYLVPDDNSSYYSNDNGEGIVPVDGIRAETVTSAATMSIIPDVLTLIDGTVGTTVITLQIPDNNLAHVWDILMTTGASPAVTIALSNSATIHYPEGFSIGASKAVEISVIGVGNTYYLRYGEFT